MKGAESILMHRERNIIAVRATQGTNTVVQVSKPIQIYLKSHRLLDIAENEWRGSG